MAFQQSRLMRMIGSALICASLIGCSKNHLENKEAYEIEQGKYSAFFEDSKYCSPVFKELNIKADKAYLRRIDSEKQFEAPLKLARDDLNRYSLEIGDYEVLAENQGVCEPVDEIKPSPELKKEFRAGKLMLFRCEKEKEE